MPVDSCAPGAERPSSPSVSVVIPTRNRGDHLLQTLQAALSGDARPLELVVVDQSDPGPAQATWEAMKEAASAFDLSISREDDSTIRKQAWLTGAPGYLRYVRSHQRGAGSARNTGAALSRGDILLFIDDDILLHRRCLSTMEQEYEAHPGIVGVYGRITPYEKADGASGRSGTEVVREGTERTVYTRPTNPWYLGSGGNMSFRRDAFDTMGGFDEVLGAGAPLQSWEDLDLGHRMLTHGLGAITYTPDALAYHDSPKNFTVQLATEKGYGIGAGAACSKYRRCGDGRARAILRNWIWHMAVRRLGAGMLKWRSWQVVRLALLQFWYPLVGIAQARQWPIDYDTWTFIAADPRTR